MNWQHLLWGISAIGSGLLAGIFLAFSNFVMAALARVEPEAGMRAMQAINKTVLNPIFLGIFIGTAVLSVIGFGLEFFLSSALNPWSTAASLLYLIGGFAVTVVCNVPLNEQLEQAVANQREGQNLWQSYQPVWTRWNHVRTIAIGMASVAWIIGLISV